jgi:hypothetical protein
MFCESCGSPLPDDNNVKYCENCGSPILINSPSPPPYISPSSSPYQSPPDIPRKFPVKNMFLVIGIIGVLIIASVVGILYFQRSNLLFPPPAVSNKLVSQDSTGGTNNIVSTTTSVTSSIVSSLSSSSQISSASSTQSGTTRTTSISRTTTTSIHSSSTSTLIPVLTLSPTSGPAGSQFTFTFNGGNPNTSYYWEAFFQPNFPFITNSAGSYTGTISVPPNENPGTYNVFIKDSSGNLVTSASFIVTALTTTTTNTTSTS